MSKSKTAQRMKKVKKALAKKGGVDAHTLSSIADELGFNAVKHAVRTVDVPSEPGRTRGASETRARGHSDPHRASEDRHSLHSDPHRSSDRLSHSAPLPSPRSSSRASHSRHEEEEKDTNGGAPPAGPTVDADTNTAGGTTAGEGANEGRARLTKGNSFRKFVGAVVGGGVSAGDGHEADEPVTSGQSPLHMRADEENPFPGPADIELTDGVGFGRDLGGVGDDDEPPEPQPVNRTISWRGVLDPGSPSLSPRTVASVERQEARERRVVSIFHKLKIILTFSQL